MTNPVSLDALLDPVLDATWKGYPATAEPRRRAQIGAAGWKVLDGDLPFPLAVIRQEPLAHNLGWMQRYARGNGIDLAPHGKTTMSPQLFKRQLEEGAWGLTFATMQQLRIGVASGARRALIANQVFMAADLDAIAGLRRDADDLRVWFLVDSVAQLRLIEAWHVEHADEAPFDVLLEIGVPGGRTGCRDDAQAKELGAALYASAAVRLGGIECYEGLGATGDSAADIPYADALMSRVHAIAVWADRENWFEGDEVVVSAGGSAIFDLVATKLRPALSRPVRGLLRSGCYVTHDQGNYTRLVHVIENRLGCHEGETLRPALEVWTAVQSCPEPGLAILAVGRRDISFDIALPTPLHHRPTGGNMAGAPTGWRITGLNDQHAYLRWDPAQEQGPQVGDLVALGISHPCTTFDKWRWMPVVDEQYAVVDAIVTCF